MVTRRDCQGSYSSPAPGTTYYLTYQERGQCHVCGKDMALNVDGGVRLHRHQGLAGKQAPGKKASSQSTEKVDRSTQIAELRSVLADLEGKMNT